MTSDIELLRQYAAYKDAAAFAEVVRRQADLVYSAARRVTANAALAQDVAQAVFTKLALHPSQLLGHDTIVGWLHTTTRREAINAVRGEIRRRARDQEAAIMQTNPSAPEVDWEQLRPILDEAVDSLREQDRKAILLRFFQGQSHREVGSVLGLSDEAARKCVDRALEKLRASFARRGVIVSSALLASSLSSNSVQAAPSGLAATLSGNALAASPVAMVGWFGAFLASFLAMTTLTKITITAAVIIAAAIPAYYLWPAAGAMSQPVSVPRQLPARPVSTAVTAPAGPVPPVMEAAASPVDPPAPLPSSVVDPQAKIDTTIAELIRLLQAGDVATAVKNFLPPDTLAQMPEAAQMAIAGKILGLFLSPGETQKEAASFRAVQNQTPTYDADGIHASLRTVDPNGFPMTFVKVDGRWYLDLVTAQPPPASIATTTAPAPPPAGNPPADLSAAIADIIRLMQAGDRVALFLKYQMSSDELAALPETQQASILQNLQAPLSGPQQQIIQSTLSEFQSIQNAIPSYDATGNHAVYTLPDGSTPPITQFHKVNGRWLMGP